MALVLFMNVVPDVWAQEPSDSHRDNLRGDVAIQGLASVQPADDSYVGSPYLDKGIGGVGPGLAVGLNVVTRRRLALTFEFSTAAALEAKQSGRLVSGTAVGRVRDSLFSFLAGAPVWSFSKAEITALAGLSLVTGTLTQNGVPIDAHDDPAAHEGDGLIAFTGGANVGHAVNRRIRVVGNIRYSAIRRSRRAEELGVGAHIIRVGAGVEVRLNR